MENPNGVWLEAVYDVIRYGDQVAPRGMPVHEIMGRQTVIYMDNPVLNIPERKLGYKFMAAEAWWIADGRSDVEFISKYSKAISNFSDDGVSFFGAYGPKIYEQITHVIKSLSEDPDTRQAVINIWRESPPKTKDVPCTLSVQFLIRDDKVHVINTMRSSDLWLGWPYDIFNFSFLSYMVCLTLRNNYGKNYRPGKLYLTAGSSHLYDTNKEAVLEILDKHKAGRLDMRRIDLDKFTGNKQMMDSLRRYCDMEGGALAWFQEYSVDDR